MKKNIFPILICVFSLHSYCQSKYSKGVYPEVGKAMPNFILSDLQNFPKKKIELNDFKGKWLVLDWWTQFCSSCVESFPKVDALQKEFNSKVQFLFIGYTGSWLYGGRIVSSNKAVRVIYEKAKQKENLTVPCAFDSILYQKYNLGTCPYIVVIDPNGIVRAITLHLSSKNIKELIAGKQISLSKAFRKDEKKPEFDERLPFLTYDNGGADTNFLYRSLLSPWQSGMPVVVKSTIFHPGNKGKFEVLAAPLERLYNYAYAGEDGWAYYDSLYAKFYPHPLLEIKDSSKFKFDPYSGKGMYCYSLIVPAEKATKEYLMTVMQSDLKNIFNYDVTVETRLMPYWKLISTEQAKYNLKTKKATSLLKNNNSAGFSATNVPVKYLIGKLWSYFQDEPPFIDETGIEYNIDININAQLTNFNDFKRALKENGLDLIISKKNMLVIVIRNK